MKLITTATAEHDTLNALAESSDSPQRDTEMLLECVTGLGRAGQLLQADQPLSEAQWAQLKALRARCQQGEPLAYVLGECEFWTLRLTVTPAVLIPRPDTELVVERALAHLASAQPNAVLELGTGSGAIALAIASERSSSHVVASDISSAALVVARGNAVRHALGNVELILSDWFAQLPQRRYALIVSNPPYIALDDPDVHQSVREYEPHTALFAGSDGLDALRHIVQEAPGFLAPGGWLVLEHGWRQATSVRRLLESVGFSSVASHADLAGHERVTEGQYLSHTPR